ncbi:signal peptide peptidase SppA [Rhodohalobacter sulfatireducens]|uniref:Signal peptide peptidase SppA n=1 Tax=Rhodohalobacter sulfatireducens TaxID=2911366 RepID=A0ABS9KCW0_9BACT|nr:signal peptide peptidase SppA [Rhodohalobacter sulfatireducens]MCG2588692.1 signal peptide peptidase SppA [Rhodohalobacter sulfatireducens]
MQFFKTFLASVLGTLIALLIIFLIFFGILASSSSQPEPYIRSNTVLKVNLSGSIPMRVAYDPFQELFNPQMMNRVSVTGLKENLKKAAADDKIPGIWIEANNVTATWANLETVYQDLREFKESGKFIYFSTDDIGMNEKAYFLATAADSIFSPPETLFQFSGFTAQLTFYRELLDKIGVEPEMLRAGRYKSVVEPYLNESSSPEYREQINDILQSFSGTFVDAVSQRTGKSPDEINDLMNTPPINRLQFAVENGLIDSLIYSDQVVDIIKERIGDDSEEDLKTVDFGRYNRVSNSSAGLESSETTDKIAVIYASGTILPEIAESPFDNNTGITAGNFKKQLDDALEDDDIKSIVIHINSPGGAATTSDILWHHIKQASGKKPVIASMGSVAASGGYYMAMGADTVLANNNTITGSIGVANMLFNVQELMEEKIGINYETLKTHEYADLFDLTTPLTDDEQAIFEANIEQSYNTFLSVVAENRRMSVEQVDAVAQGRVYSGQQALEVGLVDAIGDIDDALRIAAEMAEIEDYKIETYPKKQDLFEAFFGGANAQVKSWMFGWIPRDIQSDVNDVNNLLNQKGIQHWTLLPYKIDS